MLSPFHILSIILSAKLFKWQSCTLSCSASICNFFSALCLFFCRLQIWKLQHFDEAGKYEFWLNWIWLYSHTPLLTLAQTKNVVHILLNFLSVDFFWEIGHFSYFDCIFVMCVVEYRSYLYVCVMTWYKRFEWGSIAGARYIHE